MADTTAIARIKLQYFRSKICTPVKHKLVIERVGLTPSIRGMVATRRRTWFVYVDW